MWDCHWPRTLHYLADGVFDPTVGAELSPSLMLRLAGSGARFQCRVTHKRTHTDYVLIMAL